MITTREQKAYPVGREQLREMTIVQPKNAGRIWKGIQHGELVDAIANRLESNGIEVAGEQWYVAGQNRERMSGSMSLRIPDLEAPAGMEFSLGLHHGNDMAHALKFAVGLRVFVCSNGVVAGDFIVKRRHTNHFDLERVVNNGLDRYLEEIKEVRNTVDRMKERTYYTNHIPDEVLMDAGRNGLMPWSRIGQVDEEYRHPTFAETADHSAWGLYNAFTYVVQKCPPGHQIDAMSKFRELVLAN